MVDTLSIIIQFLLALVFVPIGIRKIVGPITELDEEERVPIWIRSIGVIELAGGVMLVIALWSEAWLLPGALLLGFLAIGKLMMHVSVGRTVGRMIPNVLFGILAFVVFLVNM